jgi:phage terminase large subunit GpA-like protein
MRPLIPLAAIGLDQPEDESGEPYPPGYCQFPKYSEEYFKQLTAEQLVTRIVYGLPATRVAEDERSK